MRALALIFAAGLLLGGCVADVPGEIEEIDSVEGAASAGPKTANVDASYEKEVRVRAGELTVWVRRVSVLTPGEEPRLTIRLRTSRNLVGAMSYVPEDGFGDARIVSPRVVEIDLRSGHEIHTILSGSPLFVHLETATGSPTQYDLKLDLGTRLTGFAGSPNTMADSAVRAVYVKDGVTNLRYRGRVRAVGPTGSTSMAATIADKHAALAVFPGRVFRYDFTPERFLGGTTVLFRATIRGARFDKTADIELGVTRVGLTTEGIVGAWPEPTCDATVAACIEAAGAEATDLGDCGDYRAVARCLVAE